jgi:hypothetical protein
MKKTSLTILVLSISILTFAQSSGDVDNQSLNNGDLENQIYFRFGYSQATTSYFGVDDNEFWDFFDRAGGVFEVGHIFIINKAALADGLRLGINVDYAEFSYHHLAYSLEDITLGVLKFASKIGPSLSYSPAEHLVFDVFVKAKIPWVAGIGIVVEGEEEFYIAKPGIGIATGINVRYRFLMLGFEYNSDKMKFESQDYPGDYFGNLDDGSDKTPLPSLSFTLGFSF